MQHITGFFVPQGLYEICAPVALAIDVFLIFWAWLWIPGLMITSIFTAFYILASPYYIYKAFKNYKYTPNNTMGVINGRLKDTAPPVPDQFRIHRIADTNLTKV